MRKMKRKILIAASLCMCAAISIGFIHETNKVFANENTTNTITETAEGVVVNLTADAATKTASFDYWNYVDVEDIYSSTEVITLEMMPDVSTVAEASSLILTVSDVLDETRAFSLIVYTSSRYYSLKSTYGAVALTKDVSVSSSSVKLSGTDQNVYGNSQLIGAGYTANGCLDVIGWNDSYTGFFCSAESDAHFQKSPLTVKFDGQTVSTSAYNSEKQQDYVRKIADITDTDFLSKSIATLPDYEEYNALRSLYDAERTKNLFTSGKVKLSFTFGGVSNNVTFRINSVSGQAVTTKEVTSAPALRADFTTKALKGMAYTLPIPQIVDVGDENITNYSVAVTSPSGGNVVITNNQFIPAEIGEYTVVYETENSNGYKTTVAYTLECLETNPQVTFLPNSSVTVAESYIVGNTVIIPAYTAASEISLLRDGAMPVSATISIENRIIRYIEDASIDTEILLSENGAYTVSYNTQNAFGLTFSQKVFSFDVIDYPIIVLEEKEVFVQRGTNYNIPKNVCEYLNSTYDTQVCVYAPDGTVVEQNNESQVTLSQAGEYTVVYSCEIEGMTAENRLTVHSVDKAQSLLQADHVTMQENFVLPNYAVDAGETGLFISTDSEATVAFKNTIDLNELTKDDILLQFLTYSNDAYGKFSMRITLTDAEDPSNKVILTIQPHGSMWQYSYIHVNYDGRTLARSTERGGTIMNLSGFGALMNVSFGAGAGHTNVNQFTLRFDYAEKAIYMDPHYAVQTQWLLLDLDDSGNVGAGKEWQGFVSGKISMTMEFYSLKSSNAGIILTEVAGQSFSGKYVDDTTAPVFYFAQTEILTIDDATQVLPNGEKGKSYALPTATAYDLIDGAVDVVYTLKLNNDVIEIFPDNRVTFEQSGTYTYTVSATDKLGNVNTREFSIDVVDQIDLLAFTLEAYDVDEVKVGQYFTLPKINVQGGSGEVILEKIYFYNGEEVELDALGRVYLTNAGTIKIVVSGVDYLGTATQGDTEFVIEVKATTVPILSVSSVPTTFFSGKTYTISDFTALQSSTGGALEECPYKAIKADGVVIYEYGTAVAEGVSGSLIYLPTKTEGTVVLEYLAGSSADNVLISESYEIPVTNLQYVSDLLSVYDYDDTCTGNTLESVDRNINGTYYKFTGNKGLRLVNVAVADGLMFSFSAQEENEQSIVIRLKDSMNAEQSIYITLQIIDGAAYMSVNGGNLLNVQGSFASIEQYFNFGISVASKCIVDETYSALALITTYQNGNSFEGFDSGLVEVSLELHSESNDACGINIFQIGNQSFSVLSMSTEFKDSLGPQIVLNGEIDTFISAVGTQVTLPSAIASDIATGKCDVTMTVTKNGFPIDGLSTVPATGYAFTYSEIATYSIVYTAKDANGRITTTVYIVNIRDVTSPEIVVSGKISTEYSVGDKLSVPTVTATDDAGEAEVVLYLCQPDGKVVTLKQGTKVEFDCAGEYRLVIYAKDAAHNVSIKTIEITVK